MLIKLEGLSVCEVRRLLVELEDAILDISLLASFKDLIYLSRTCCLSKVEVICRFK